jgi:hypothetical protein
MEALTMKKLVLCAILLAMVSPVSAQNPSTMELAATPRMLTAGDTPYAEEVGMWEYVYDFYGNGVSQLPHMGIYGFDTSLIVNDRGAEGNDLSHNWGYSAANNFYASYSTAGSISLDGETWTVGEGGIDNIWHTPDEYGGMGVYVWALPGFAMRDWGGAINDEGGSLVYTAKLTTGNILNGLLLTFRVVHPNAPGSIEWYSYSYNAAATATGFITGPGPGDPTRPGDFTDDLGGLPDMVIDAFDIDALADAILNGGDVATFDLVIDGVLDSLDMDMLIEMLVDTTVVDAGEEYGFVTGSFYGDFNLDGTVNLLDLNKLTANYNGTGGWTLGDANGDGSIALLDLNKLTANYNSTVVVPEPATIFVMACGAAAMIRRRRRA